MNEREHYYDHWTAADWQRLRRQMERDQARHKLTIYEQHRRQGLRVPPWAEAYWRERLQELST